MAPKPFQPPRPAGRPKGNTSNGTKRKSTDSTSASTSKVKKNVKANTNGTKKKAAEMPHEETRKRTSFLPSLSPDSVAPEEEEEAEEEAEEELDDPFATQPTRSAKSAAKPTTAHSDEEAERSHEPGIPQDLLAVLLHQFFQDKSMRIGKNAMGAVGVYMDTFVREAVARAVWEREKGGGGMGGELEVEDLEKLAPQLLLDF